jgi:hypothetical protein
MAFAVEGKPAQYTCAGAGSQITLQVKSADVIQVAGTTFTATLSKSNERPNDPAYMDYFSFRGGMRANSAFFEVGALVQATLFSERQIPGTASYGNVIFGKHIYNCQIKN